MSAGDEAQDSLLELFREEARTQAQILSDGLLALERAPRAPDTLEACMRAAHSLKGAARIVGVPVGVTLAHVMEDCFVAAQEGRLTLDAGYIVACPLARGTMGYQGIAETDVYDVLADVLRRYPIDRNRIYLTGISMGATGALRFALTRPAEWAAVALVCPGADPRLTVPDPSG